MSVRTLSYILVMAGVTYLIRMLPLTLIRRQIRSPFIRSFLYYVSSWSCSCVNRSSCSSDQPPDGCPSAS